MTIVLRLEGLDVKAESEDIRIFFDELHIKDGGVVIVGGRLREAFIVFTNERDGQLAMRRSGHFLKGSRVTLYVSSMAEMCNKTESSLRKMKKRKKPLIPDKRPLPPPTTDPRLLSIPDERPPPPQTTNPPLPSIPEERPSPPPTTNPPLLPISDEGPLPTSDMSNALTSLFGILQHLQSHQQGRDEERTAVVVDELRAAEDSYVRLFGLPASVTKQDICHFFTGLQVHEVIVNVELGVRRGCLVKFTNFKDRCDALHFNNQRLGSVCVEVRGASEKMWNNAVEECANHTYRETNDTPVSPEMHYEHQRDPSCELQRDRDSLRCEMLYRQRPRAKRRFKDHLPHPQKKPTPECTSTTDLPPTVEYCIMVKNLPQNITKTEIKELFGCLNIPHNNILHLLDMDGQRTDTAFIKFDNVEDYVYAMNLNGCHVASHAINVSAVTEERMEAMLATSYGERLQHLNSTQNAFNKRKRKKPSMDVEPTSQTCLYVRNLPGDVRKTEIKDLFCLFKPEEVEIFLMRDKYGNGIGEAVVQFKSEKEAALAQQRLHGQIFLGTEVFLSCISVKQMGDVLKGNQ